MLSGNEKESGGKNSGNKGGRIRAVIACVAAAIVGGALAGGAMAYFSARDYGVNKLMIGNVQIEASEPGFPPKDENGDGVPDDCELVIPYETITKDPRIRNTGNNDAVVFFKVTSPVEMLTLIDDSGTRHDEALEELFWFKQKGDSDGLHQNNFNANWIRLTDLDGQIVDCEGINEEGQGYVYIFGYHTRIEPGETTATLFDKVQNKKYGSKTISANEKEIIRIEPYAIQADDILRDGITVDTTGEISAEDLSYIYQAFFNQNQEPLD